MVESALQLTLAPSPTAWVDCVLSEFDHFLSDHASCEKKASGMALSVASHYPDKPELLKAMTELAVEELTHYREVIRILLNKGLTPLPDEKDPYIAALNGLVRRGPENYLLDRLLIGAVVERRGAERFGLIANALQDPDLKKFYQSITQSEERHWTLFVALASNHCLDQPVIPRLEELFSQEAKIMQSTPIRPALH